MHEFKVIDNALFCEKCRISDIIKQTGTPAYIYSSKTIIDHFEKIKNAFAGHNTQLCYSVKANSNINILRLLKEKGAGADIVSGGELFRALTAGIPAQKIVYSGVGKTDFEIEYAIKSDILCFNVESIPELHRINEIAKTLNKKVRISIRVNPDVDAHTHHFITTGKKETKFGLSIDEIERHYSIAAKLSNLIIYGIDVHLGSSIITTEPYVEALKIISKAIDNLRKNNIRLEILDIGGGFGIIYNEEKAISADDFAKAIVPLVKKMDLNLIIEPGRFIVGNAGILVARATYIKDAGAKIFTIVDAGMNDLIRPPLYDSYHNIKPIENINRPAKTYDVVGPICESADFFGKDREIPEIKQGEFIAIMSAGAYGFAMTSNYNSRPKACEILVDNDNFKIIRKRETYEDLIKGEV